MGHLHVVIVWEMGGSGRAFARLPTHDDETVMNGAPGFVGAEKRSGVSHPDLWGDEKMSWVGTPRLWGDEKMSWVGTPRLWGEGDCGWDTCHVVSVWEMGRSGRAFARLPTHDDETVMNGAPGFVEDEKRSWVSYADLWGTKSRQGLGGRICGGSLGLAGMVAFGVSMVTGQGSRVA